MTMPTTNMDINCIDIALVTWPNHPARFDYFCKCMDALWKNLSASRHVLRFFCSAESERDPHRPWLGNELECYCEEHSISLSWRDARANLGANMNAALRLGCSPTVLLQQDDWMLLEPLDLSPGADFLCVHREVDLIRYSWPDNDRMCPTFIAQPDGWRKIDMARKWPYGDDPHLRHRSFMGRYGWYLEGGRHGSASGTLMRLLLAHNANIRAADRCYYVHGGPVTSVIGDIRNRREQR